MLLDQLHDFKLIPLLEDPLESLYVINTDLEIWGLTIPF
jgi:hypothetical protein